MNRIGYLDCFRGMVMLMVVFCHTFGEFSLSVNSDCWFSRVFSLMMLAGFFFISGWFSRLNLYGGGILKRFKTTLLPTIMMFLIYVYFYWGTFDKLVLCASGEYKWGYWFTFALFLINLLHWGVSALARAIAKDENKRAILTFGIFAVLWTALFFLKHWDWYHNGATLANWLSLVLIAKYLPFYVLGMFCRWKEDVFHRTINNDYVAGIVLAAFALCLLRKNGGFFFGLLTELFGVALLYRFCFRYKDVLSDKTFVGRQLSMIGRNTLPIYLIHYFFFLGLKIPTVGLALDTETQWGAIFCVAAAITLAVTYASIGIAKVIGVSDTLSKLLTGK